MEHKSLTLDGFNGRHLLLLLLAVAASGISLYLTNHYMDFHFPSGLVGGSLCDINSTFNCDASTSSAFSNILGIPISVFGLFFGANLILATIFANPDWERINHALSYLNVIGCFILLVYSFFALGSFCPFCMGYWGCSAIIAYLFYKYGVPLSMPSPSSLAIVGALAVFIIGAYGWNISEKEKKAKRMSFALAQQFRNLPAVVTPDSPHKIHMSTENFKDAPLRISKFSDFQCPACKDFADNIPKLIERYKGKINIQYLFYPLDSNCNTGMKRQLHPLACEAAYLAHCSKEKFATVHDEIFHHQAGLTQTWIDKKANELGVLECKNSADTKSFVQEQVETGNKVGVQSTPTLVINGKRIAGSLPLSQFYLLLDELLKMQNQ